MHLKLLAYCCIDLCTVNRKGENVKGKTVYNFIFTALKMIYSYTNQTKRFGN